ncbi:MAG: hypothetical protein ACJA01_002730 [Saprospiraceae bacterium]|jgi:hypothetical protein
MIIKIAKYVLVIITVILVGILVWAYYNIRDRHNGYEVNISIEALNQNAIYKIGFGKEKITPEIIDTWIDIDGNAKYQEDKGDTYVDVNKNSKFDPVWIAGFSNNKPANGVHDDVWARAVIIDDGVTRIAMVSLDAIGYMYKDVVDIRKMIPEELGIDYTLIAATHTHESNDLIGMWGPDILHSGVDDQQMIYVKKQTIKAIRDAVSNMQLSKILFAEDLSGRDSLLIKDTRKPIVKATGIHVMHVLHAENNATLGTIVNWANHPETLWSKNLLISSDFPHYIRESIEKGIVYEGDTILQASGGISIFFNGAVGGLMAPHPSLPFNDPIRDEVFKEPSFEKTRTLGEQIAMLGMSAIASSDTLERMPSMDLEARSILLPLKNRNFRIASAIGLIERGMPKIFQTRTEVAAFNIGHATFLSIPGEMYPEIIYGGIESPPGQDIEIGPVEIPPLEERIPRKYKFYLGLANDEIGYIIPKSEWDAEAPWLYLDEGDTYGEENSMGPETAPILHAHFIDLLDKIK